MKVPCQELYISPTSLESSPVCVYNKDGSGKVLYCNSTGDIRLLDGKTGKQEDVLSVSEGVIEASPAVYDNYAVVGTRAVSYTHLSEERNLWIDA